MQRLAGPRADFEPCPAGTNALVPMLAFVVTHDFFRSDTGRGEDGDGVENRTRNVSTSYLDLTPIYGHDAATQRAARALKRGHLKPDVVQDVRLAQLHSARAILFLFVREHNHVCDELARRYPDRFGGADADADADEALFQQARLITCGTYISCLFQACVAPVPSAPM